MQTLAEFTAEAPAAGPAAVRGAPRAWEKRLLARLLQRYPLPGVRVALWDDQPVVPVANPFASVTFLDRAALIRTMLDPEFQFPECYALGRIRLEGNLVSLLDATYRARPAGGPQWFAEARNTLARARTNIHHHYDIGNDFYRLWLDEQMLYTCAYYADPAMSLEAAQVAKMDHVCRKLQLKAGERVVEAGCGWGALAIHMASRYGVHVKAYNISREQIAYARQRAKALGLDRQVEFIEDDYRTIGSDGERFDAFVSVGMLEHVGVPQYHDLGAVIRRSLRPGPGVRGLIHSITRHRPMRLARWIRARIFPGAQPPTLRQMMDIFEPFNLAVLDAENLRLHYAQTLRHWLERFENARDQVARMFDERFVRTWRMYLAGSIAAFNTGTLQLTQVLFAPHDDPHVPGTRTHLYR